MEKRFSKKGQVALFVIIGLLVVGTILVIFLVMKNTDLDSVVPVELQGLESLLNNCVEQRAIDAIWLIGLSGGYVESPLNSLETSFGNISYGLKDEKNVLVDKKIIEKEISDYLTFALPYCANAEDYSYNVTFKNPSSEVKIYDDYVRVYGNIDFRVEKDSYVELFKREYSHDIPIQMGKILSASNFIFDSVS